MSYLFNTTIFLCFMFSVFNAQSILMQEEQFGKNIVQYSDFDWNYIKTENFLLNFSRQSKAKNHK